MSHLGRPDGKVNAKYSLKPVVPELEKLLGGKKVEMAPDCVGKEVEDIVNKASEGQVVLLENLRFHAEEEGSSKDAEGKKVKADKEKVEEFRKGLTALGDIYISEFVFIRSFCGTMYTLIGQLLYRQSMAQGICEISGAVGISTLKRGGCIKFRSS